MPGQEAPGVFYFGLMNSNHTPRKAMIRELAAAWR
jgi:hypothetical protein